MLCLNVKQVSMPKRVLITGAAGFVGSHLCDKFINEGCHVIGMDNLITGDLKNIEHLFALENFEFYNHDVTKFVHIPGSLDYILHFASPASPIDYLKIPIQTLKVGSLGTHNLLGLAKEKGAFVFGVCNVVGSSIARETHSGAYTHAGPEIGVASTKAFTTQITVLTLIALKLGQANGTLAQHSFENYIKKMQLIPKQVEELLNIDEKVKEIASVYKDAKNCLYLGRGFNFPVALEGALKLKEISYIHAEGYPAAEMKHGPIALIDENMPIFVIATNKGHYEKVVSNIQEIKSRAGKIIAIVTEGDTTVKEIADHVIEIPETEEALTPLLTTIPFQLLSYHIAVMLGKNVDQPRNLAKSVTVE